MGNFTEQTGGTVSPPPTPLAPLPRWASRFPLSVKAGASNYKDIPHPRQWCSACQRPCLLWRVWQSKYLQKQLWPDAKFHFYGTHGEICTRKGFSVWQHTAWWWGLIQGPLWLYDRPGASQSFSQPFNFRARALFTEHMNNYIYCWGVSSEMYQFRTTGRNL